MMARWSIMVALVLAFAQASAGEHSGHDMHAGHRAAMQQARYSATTATYEVPDVELLDQSGAAYRLLSLLETDRPIALNFIFTTCTTICPVMTVTFAQVKNVLGNEADRVHLVSISIDPEYDRPDVLQSYAKQFKAGENWTFLTGKTSDIVAILRSFDAYTGSKMSHRPVTLLKRPDDDAWTRIDGLPNGEMLAQEISTRLLN
jgi:protein SCO1/2